MEVKDSSSAALPEPAGRETDDPDTLVIDDFDGYWEAYKYDRMKQSYLGTSEGLPVLPDESIPEPLLTEAKRFRLTGLNLTVNQLTKGVELLLKFPTIFSKNEYDLGCLSNFKCVIDTGDAKPIKCNFRPLPHAKLTALAEQLQQFEKAGLIRRSQSVWASAIVMVPKPNGDWRVCQDYRPVNSVALCCQHPIPRIDDMLNRFLGKRFFSAMDLAKGFHQIPMEESSIPKTAFVTPIGQYEFLRMPFGLHSAPGTFQAAMSQILAGLEHMALVYVDDVIIFSDTFEQHLLDVEEVFKRLRDVNLKANPVKCEFFRTSLKYLGFIVSSRGIETDPKKVEAIKNTSIPSCTMELETFLGKVGFYSRFIKDYSSIVYPLMRLKLRDAIFQMGEEEIKAFNTLKNAMCEAPVLEHPDFSKKFFYFHRRFWVCTGSSFVPNSRWG